MNSKNQEEEKLIVGIDLHPDSFAGAVFSGDTIYNCRKLFIHEKVSTEDWEKWLKRYIPKGSVLVMEAGNNSFAFAEISENLGYKPVILDSFKIGRIAKSYCKNDKTDAEKAAKVYLSGLCKTNVWIPDQLTKHKRELLSTYKKTVKDATRAKNRLKSFLTAHKIRLKGKYTALTKKETFEHILRLMKWTKNQELIITLHFEDIIYNDEKRRRLHRIITSEVLNSEYGQKLLSLCGIRIICAFSIMAAVGDINRFKNPKKVVAYFGFSPKCHESGNTTKKGKISRRGRKEVKSVLIQAAQAIMRSRNNSGEKLKKWGMALYFRKERNVVVAAIARKLTVAVWYTLKGYLPEIVKVDNDIQRKLKKIAEELKLVGVKALGYDKVKDFIEEYSQIICLRS